MTWEQNGSSFASCTSPVTPAIARHGRLDPGVPYLQNPFMPEALAAKVRAVLDAPVAAPALPEPVDIQDVARGLPSRLGPAVPDP